MTTCKIFLEELDKLAISNLCLPAEGSREFVLKKFLDFYKSAEYSLLKEDFNLMPSDFCLIHSSIVDHIIKGLFNFSLNSAFPKKYNILCTQFAVVATCEYARQETTPFSEHYIHLVSNQVASKNDIQFLQEVFQQMLVLFCWNAHLNVIFTVDSVDSFVSKAQNNIHKKIGFSKTRLIFGDKSLFNTLLSVFQHCCLKDHELDLTQIIDNYEKTIKNKNLFPVEPNILCDISGLRSLRILDFVEQIYNESGILFYLMPRSDKLLSIEDSNWLKEHRQFLLFIRNHLHLLSQSNQNKFLREYKFSLDSLFDDSSDILSDKWYKNTNIFNDIWGSVVCKIQTKFFKGGKWWPCFKREIDLDGFSIINDQIFPLNDNIFKEVPVRIIRVFKYCQSFGLKLSREIKSLISENSFLIESESLKNSDISETFLSILTTPGNVSDVIYEIESSGLLKIIISEFNCFYNEENKYSKFTFGCRVLKSLEQLDEMFQCEDNENVEYYNILSKTDNVELLYVSLLLHSTYLLCEKDEIVFDILKKLGLTKPQIEIVLFLINNTNKFYRLSQNFDPQLSNREHVIDQIIPDINYLNLLYLHTICDIKSSSVTNFNTYKQVILKNFYQSLSLELKHVSQPLFNIKKYRLSLLDEIFSNFSSEIKDEICEHFNKITNDYFIKNSYSKIKKHIEMVISLKNKKEIEKNSPIFIFDRNLNDATISLEIVSARNRELLFRVSQALSLSGFDIISVNCYGVGNDIIIIHLSIMLLHGENLEKYYNDFLNHFDHFDGIKNIILNVLQKKISKDQRFNLFKSRIIQTKVNVFHNMESNVLTIECQTYNRIGLLTKITYVLASKDFEILSAKISSNCNILHDTFYVTKDIINPKELLEIREELHNILSS